MNFRSGHETQNFSKIVESHMADRPMTSMSRTGRPRTRSRSVHIPSHLPIASKAGKHRTASAQRALTKGKDAGKGKKIPDKSNKPVVEVSSDSEDLEVDFTKLPSKSASRGTC